MSTAASGLKELHELHVRLHDVRQKLDGGPKQIEARKRFTGQKQQEIETFKEQVKQMKMAADQKSLQLKTNESKIIDLKVKLNAAVSNREFDIIKSQIDADTMSNSVLEDEILEIFEKIDGLNESMANVEEQRKAAEAEEKRVAEQVSSVGPGLESEAAELSSSLSSAESELPGTVLETYRRLVQAHGAGALASVKDKACTACFSILSPQLCVEVNIGKLIFCRSCGRLLYRSEED